MANIGNSLKEHRQVCGYTQSELAKQTGIKQQNISRWESNIHNPDIVDCIKLANFYGITLDELLGPSDDGAELYSPPTAGTVHGAQASDETRLLEIYRSLSPDMRSTLWSLLDTWSPSVQKNKV